MNRTADAPVLRDRMRGIALAVALQLGIAALLILSFTVVRYLPEAKETTLVLPPLVLPKPPPPGRSGGSSNPSAAAPMLPPSATAPFVPSGPPASLPPLDLRSFALPASPFQGIKRPDPKTVTINPPSHVKDPALWAQELQNKNGPPPDVPCVDSPTSSTVAGGKADKTCAIRVLGMALYSLPPPNKFHASGAQFQAALSAVQARAGIKHAPALALAPQGESGHEKDSDGGAGVRPDAGNGAAVPGR